MLLLIFFVTLVSSCRLPDNFGFYQPLTLRTTAPDGPPEFKAGWYDGCRTGLATRTSFANSWVYGNGFGPSVGNGIYQHDKTYNNAWGEGWRSCVIRTERFVNNHSMKFSPLQ